jgi:hypothetical protein
MNIKTITTVLLLLFSVSVFASYESDLIESYKKLKLGISKEAAQEIMGTPTERRRNITKKGKFIGYSFTYLIYRHEEGLVNLKNDKVIKLFFDVNGNLKWVVPQNIKGLEEIGTPER